MTLFVVALCAAPLLVTCLVALFVLHQYAKFLEQVSSGAFDREVWLDCLMTVAAEQDRMENEGQRTLSFIGAALAVRRLYAERRGLVEMEPTQEMQVAR